MKWISRSAMEKLLTSVILHQMVKNLIGAGICLVDAFRCATCNPASIIHAEGIGKIKKGFSADILVLNDNLDIENIFVDGKQYQ